MNGRTYSLALVFAVVAGIGLTAALADAHARWDIANTDRGAADSARARVPELTNELMQLRQALLTAQTAEQDMREELLATQAQVSVARKATDEALALCRERWAR